MSRLLTPRWEAALVAVVTLVGMGLRFHDFGVAPGFTDNADELVRSRNRRLLIEFLQLRRALR